MTDFSTLPNLWRWTLPSVPSMCPPESTTSVSAQDDQTMGLYDNELDASRGRLKVDWVSLPSSVRRPRSHF